MNTELLVCGGLALALWPGYDVARWLCEPRVKRIGRKLGLRGEVGTLPFMAPTWQFTYEGEGAAHGATFYMPAGSSLKAVAARWAEKREEFEAAQRYGRNL
jgi:hypothetical protein